MKEPLRARIEEAARENGVSANAEILNRLERSFRQEENTYTIFGSKLRYRQMQLLAVAIQLIEEQTGHKWTEDYETAQAVRQAFDSFVDMFAKGEPLKGLERVTADQFLGERVFKEFMQSIATSKKQETNSKSRTSRD